MMSPTLPTLVALAVTYWRGDGGCQPLVEFSPEMASGPGVLPCHLHLSAEKITMFPLGPW